MALAYPEGECFFVRTALDSGSSSGYHASDVKEFYSHMMVEYIWNVESDHGSKNANSPTGRTHPRTGYKIVKGSWWDTHYGAWANLPFNYGPSEGTIKRRVQHNLCTSGNRFRNHEKGGSSEAWIMFMPMPTIEERWVWIDMLSYIRAIYLPVAHSVSKDHPDLCSFVQVNFALDRAIKTWRGGDQFVDHKTEKVLGLGKSAGNTVGLDVAGLIQLLTPPRQLRRDNCYNLRLIKIVSASTIKTVSVTKSFEDRYDKSWLDVAKGNFGLDLTWRPAEKTTWMESFIRNTLTVAIGFVPGIGPLLQVAFTVGWTLLSEEDPGAAFAMLKELCPGLDLAEHVVQELTKASSETRKFLPDEWEKLKLTAQKGAFNEIKSTPKPIEDMDRMLPMLLQKEVLDATGNSPDNNEKKEDTEEGPTVTDNPESDSPIMNAGE